MLSPENIDPATDPVQSQESISQFDLDQMAKTYASLLGLDKDDENLIGMSEGAVLAMKAQYESWLFADPIF
jgi:hypothetical protein